MACMRAPPHRPSTRPSTTIRDSAAQTRVHGAVRNAGRALPPRIRPHAGGCAGFDRLCVPVYLLEGGVGQGRSTKTAQSLHQLPPPPLWKPHTTRFNPTDHSKRITCCAWTAACPSQPAPRSPPSSPRWVHKRQRQNATAFGSQCVPTKNETDLVLVCHLAGRFDLSPRPSPYDRPPCNMNTAPQEAEPLTGGEPAVRAFLQAKEREAGVGGGTRRLATGERGDKPWIWNQTRLPFARPLHPTDPFHHGHVSVCHRKASCHSYHSRVSRRLSPHPSIPPTKQQQPISNRAAQAAAWWASSSSSTATTWSSSRSGIPI